MSLEITLAPVANQRFSIRLDDHQYEMAIKAANGVMAMDVVRDGKVIETGARVVAGTVVIPYRYQEDGNFIFFTLNDEYPDYTKFGTTQSLIYFSQTELDDFRGSS